MRPPTTWTTDSMGSNLWLEQEAYHQELHHQGTVSLDIQQYAKQIIHMASLLETTLHSLWRNIFFRWCCMAIGLGIFQYPHSPGFPRYFCLYMDVRETSLDPITSRIRRIADYFFSDIGQRFTGCKTSRAICTDTICWWFTSPDSHTGKIDTLVLLTALADKGHKVSPYKLQFCKAKVEYLGYTLEGTQLLSLDRIQAIQTIPRPQTKKKNRCKPF